MRASSARIALHCGLIFGIAVCSCSAQENPGLTPQADACAERFQNPELLSFEDLVTLASTDKPEGALQAGLSALLDTPFVQSAAADIQPHRPTLPGLGVVLRVGQWNIERGLNFELIRFALSDRSEFLDPRGTKQSFRFAPNLPVTMRELNEAAEESLIIRR
ncbi:MAG: hypothetical protein WBW31_04720 [Candidatus Sulfotelmatobacter sp.]